MHLRRIILHLKRIITVFHNFCKLLFHGYENVCNKQECESSFFSWCPPCWKFSLTKKVCLFFFLNFSQFLPFLSNFLLFFSVFHLWPLTPLYIMLCPHIRSFELEYVLRLACMSVSFHCYIYACQYVALFTCICKGGSKITFF